MRDRVHDPVPELGLLVNARRLSLSREVLTPLESDELSSIVGGITNAPNCHLLSLQFSWCANVTSCGIACTYDCVPTRRC